MSDATESAQISMQEMLERQQQLAAMQTPQLRSASNYVHPLPADVLAAQRETEEHYRAEAERERSTNRRTIALGCAVQVAGQIGAEAVIEAAKDFDAFLSGEEKTRAH